MPIENICPYLNDPIAITPPRSNNNGKGILIQDYQYIMEQAEFRTLFADIDNKILHPITIINVNYETKLIDVPNKRIDFVTAQYTLRDECKNLRITASENICMESDEYFANLCVALYEGRDGTKIPHPCFYTQLYDNNMPKLQYKTGLKDKHGRLIPPKPYMEYNCPMLSYTELCFPIILHGKVIGVMFVGDIQRNSTQEESKKIIEAFAKEQALDEPGSCFKAYQILYNEKFSSEIKNNEKEPFSLNWLNSDSVKHEVLYPKLTTLDDTTISRTFEREMDDDTLDLFIGDCCKYVYELENQLGEKWNEKCKQYYNSVAERINAQFEEEYNALRAKSKEISKNTIQDMFRAVWKAAIDFKKSMGFSYCRLFENYQFIKGKSLADEFSKDNGDCKYSDLHFDFVNTDLSMSECKCSLTQGSSLLNHFKYKWHDEELFINTNNHDHVALGCDNIVFIFGVEEWYQKKHRQLKNCFDEIGYCISHICGQIERAASLFLEEQHKKTLHLYKHEIAHLAKRMQHKGAQIGKPYRLNRLSDEQKALIAEDIESITRTMQRLSGCIIQILEGKAGVTKSKGPGNEYDFLQLFHELNKWRSTYRLELQYKNMRLDNQSIRGVADTYSNTDADLFSIMLFNLIDNAIKYAHWGTRIIVNAYPDEIVITDYGEKIDEDEKLRIFDLYYRSRNIEQEYIGDGVGLYSSKQIADLLGYEITCESKQIAPFHIGFAEKLSLENKSSWLAENLHCDYLSYLSKSRDYITPKELAEEKALSIIAEKEVLSDVFTPTYEVKFSIKIN